MRKITLSIILLTLSASLVSGCGSNASKTSTEAVGKTETDQPVTLTVFQEGANIADDEFRDLIADPVKEKFPNVTMKLVRPGKGSQANDLITAGQFPDLIFTSIPKISEFLKLGLPYDLSGFIKSYQFDLNKFEPKAMEAIKSMDNKGHLYALPFSENFGALYYNKDIFDKFGAPYPHDGMTWDEAAELAHKFVGTVDGVQYKAFNPGFVTVIGTGLSLPYIDATTGKAALESDGWQKVFNVAKAVTEIPGNQDLGNVSKQFVQERNLAMMASLGARIGELEEAYKQGIAINWV